MFVVRASAYRWRLAKRRNVIIRIRIEAQKQNRVPHPSGLRVRVLTLTLLLTFLSLALAFDPTTSIAINCYQSRSIPFIKIPIAPRPIFGFQGLYLQTLS